MFNERRFFAERSRDLDPSGAPRSEREMSLAEDPAALTGIVAGASFAVAFIVVALWIPLVGWAPRWALRWEARLIRCAKGASGRPGAKQFTYDEIAPGVLLGALPHGVEDVKSLQAEDGGPSVKCFVTMNEAWEMPGAGRTTTVDELRGLLRCSGCQHRIIAQFARPT